MNVILNIILALLVVSFIAINVFNEIRKQKFIEELKKRNSDDEMTLEEISDCLREHSIECSAVSTSNTAMFIFFVLAIMCCKFING